MALRTRGMNLGAARAYVKERFKDVGWNRLVARLPERDVAEVWDTLILPTGWYDYALHGRFLDALDAEFRALEPDLGRELGRRAAQSDIRFYHSQTIAFVSPARVLDQCARLWAEHYSEGRLEVEERGHDSFKIVLVNPGVHWMVCSETVPGWGERAIVLAGARSARAEHVLCVRKGFSHCEYVVDWE
jgi:hypothetical protein